MGPLRQRYVRAERAELFPLKEFCRCATIPKDGNVSLKVFDVLGREVASLVNDVRVAGSYTEVFDASQLSSGTYLYRLESGSFVQTKKMLIMK